MWRKHFIQTLRQSFESAQSKNKSYSLRAFARKLEVSPGTLSELLRDRRQISKELALEIAAKTGFDAKSLQQLRLLIAEQDDLVPRTVLSEHAADLIMHPLYYRIVCALEVLPSPTGLRDIAAMLQEKESEVGRAVDVLKSLDLLEEKENAIAWRGRRGLPPPDAPGEKTREFHRQTLRNLGEDLMLPAEEREYASIIFAATSGRMPAAKDQIRTFRDELAETMRGSRPDRVFQLSIQLRPVSNLVPPTEKS